MEGLLLLCFHRRVAVSRAEHPCDPGFGALGRDDAEVEAEAPEFERAARCPAALARALQRHTVESKGAVRALAATPHSWEQAGGGGREPNGTGKRASQSGG